ncbi:MAG: TlpA disulfide reductase family protein [Micrococcales bacterium]|nr:TlpA disulfide reductase family protein [Micrococcales bacterium]
MPLSRRELLARARAAGLVSVLAVSLGTTAACADGNSVAEQAKRGDDKGFIAGDGTIEQIAADRRGAPLDLSGTLLDGTPWQMSQAVGKVLVVNVWGSWCEPCLAEAPHLVAAAKTLTGKHADVAFLGIDLEAPQTGAAAAKTLGLPYPSLNDENRGYGPRLQNKATSTPTTLVLDRLGRIAARISGEIKTPTTLVALVESVVAERA